MYLNKLVCDQTLTFKGDNGLSLQYIIFERYEDLIDGITFYDGIPKLTLKLKDNEMKNSASRRCSSRRRGDRLVVEC